MVERLKTHEVESLARSMAMAPLSQDSVARLVRSHGASSHDWAEFEGLLQRLGRRGPSSVGPERAQRGGGTRRQGSASGRGRFRPGRQLRLTTEAFPIGTLRIVAGRAF